MQPSAPQISVSVTEKATDRYTSFEGIDCDGRASRMMAAIVQMQLDSVLENPFLSYFLAKRTPKSGPIPDDLFLIHSNINQIREFFEAAGDQHLLDLLMMLEEECC